MGSIKFIVSELEFSVKSKCLSSVVLAQAGGHTEGVEDNMTTILILKKTSSIYI